MSQHRQAYGDMIIVRYADEVVFGLEDDRTLVVVKIVNREY